MHPNRMGTEAPVLWSSSLSLHLAVHLYWLSYLLPYNKLGGLSLSLGTVSHYSKLSNLSGQGWTLDSEQFTARSDTSMGNLRTLGTHYLQLTSEMKAVCGTLSP